MIHARLILFLFVLCGFGTSNAQGTLEVSHGATDPFLSPDGKAIGFELLGRIWQIDVSGGAARSLTSNHSIASEGVFSPYGKKLAYRRRTSTGDELVVRDIMTQEETILIPGRSRDSNESDLKKPLLGGGVRFKSFAFLVDGRSLLIDLGTKAVKVDVFDRAIIEEINGITLSGFAMSANNKLILTNYPRPSFGTAREARSLVDLADRKLSRVSVLDLEKKALTNLLKARDRGFSVAQFAADQQSFFFVEWQGGTERIVETDLNGENRRVILEGVLGNREFVVHPDGKALIVTTDGKVFRVDIESGEATPIPFIAKVETKSAKAGKTLITNARLFSGVRTTTEDHANVLIDDGRIKSVSFGGPHPDELHGADVIDAGGRFIMTGLVDSHAHVSYQRPVRLSDLLHSGVTSVIDPGTRYPDTINQKVLINMGIIEGPRIYNFSDAIDGVGNTVISINYTGFVTDPEVGRALVRRYRNLGYTGIKLYSALSPEVSRAVIDEAQKNNIVVLGHLGATSWMDAVDAGIDGVTHMTPFLCDSRFSGAGNRYRGFVPPNYVCLETLFQKMVAKGITFDPTMVKLHPQLRYEDEALSKRLSHDPTYPFGSEYNHNSRVLRMAHAAGVNITIGTDQWSRSLIDEMEVYEKIGIPRADILRMATANAAKFLKKGHEFGTVEVGRRADLILVDGNPLKRIGDLRNITMVIKEGEIFVDRRSADKVAIDSETVH